MLIIFLRSCLIEIFHAPDMDWIEIPFGFFLAERCVPPQSTLSSCRFAPKETPYPSVLVVVASDQFAFHSVDRDIVWFMGTDGRNCR